MATFSILVRVCIWVLVFNKLKAHGVPMALWVLHSTSWLKLLCFCLCLLDAIVELHAMDEKMLYGFLVGK